MCKLLRTCVRAVMGGCDVICNLIPQIDVTIARLKFHRTVNTPYTGKPETHVYIPGVYVHLYLGLGT